MSKPTVERFIEEFIRDATGCQPQWVAVHENDIPQSTLRDLAVLAYNSYQYISEDDLGYDAGYRRGLEQAAQIASDSPDKRSEIAIRLLLATTQLL